MDQQAFAVYVNERFVPELSRSRQRMERDRRICRFLLIGEITGLVAIPILLFLRREEAGLDWAAVMVSLLVLGGAMARKILHCDRRWVQEAQTADLLREEWDSYDAGADGYGKEADPHRLFIHRVELHLARPGLTGSPREITALRNDHGTQPTNVAM